MKNTIYRPNKMSSGKNIELKLQILMLSLSLYASSNMKRFFSTFFMLLFMKTEIVSTVFEHAGSVTQSPG